MRCTYPRRLSIPFRFRPPTFPPFVRSFKGTKPYELAKLLVESARAPLTQSVIRRGVCHPNKHYLNFSIGNSKNPGASLTIRQRRKTASENFILYQNPKEGTSLGLVAMTYDRLSTSFRTETESDGDHTTYSLGQSGVLYITLAIAFVTVSARSSPLPHSLDCVRFLAD